MIYLLILLLPIIIYFLNIYLIDRSILLNYSGDKHQKFASKNNLLVLTIQKHSDDIEGIFKKLTK